jgi:PleD family two-component response regulator
MQAFRVLIASEDKATVVALQQAMGQAAYEVHAVDSGAALLEKARECKPDLVFLDMDMPQNGAVAAFRSLKDDSEMATIPVICLTAESFAEPVLETYKIEKCDHFKRPFTAREVLMRVEAQVELRRTREELKAKAAELQELNDKLANMIRIDPLTNLLNRRLTSCTATRLGMSSYAVWAGLSWTFAERRIVLAATGERNLSSWPRKPTPKKLCNSRIGFVEPFGRWM